MYRWLMSAVLAVFLTGLVAGQDIVYYYDRVTKKDKEQVRGTIEEESPKGIKIKVKDGKQFVSKLIQASDIREVTYKIPNVTALEWREPFGKERAARLATGKKRSELLGLALDKFAKLEEQARGTPNARRYLLYKIAEVTAVMAQNDPSKVDDAIKKLTDFKSNNATSWAIVPALKTLAKLQEDAGKTDDARKTYEELAELPDVPKDLKQESEILVGRLLLRGKKYADAQTRLEKLDGSMSADDAQKPFVLAFLAESKIGQNKLDGVEKQLKTVIASSSDGRLRGVAWALLGDYYRVKDQQAEAFWAYLRVDARYNDDPEAQAKALYYLAKLFDEYKKDPLRGKDCIRRLRDKRFAGTAYQKMLPPEEKTETEKEPKKGKKPVKKKDR
jgi:predicted negative regulator of RcsB-dependent stress response